MQYSQQLIIVSSRSNTMKIWTGPNGINCPSGYCDFLLEISLAALDALLLLAVILSDTLSIP